MALEIAMSGRRRDSRGNLDAWPVIADGFLALLAVVVVMASGRESVDEGVEKLKSEIVDRSRGEFVGLLEPVEPGGKKWTRLIFREDTLSFPKCQWSLPIEKQHQIHSLFQWIGTRRELIRQIRIEGHADLKWEGLGCKDVGPFLDNLQLSQNRARSVYNVLLGLSPEDKIGLRDVLSGKTVPSQGVDGLDYLRDFAKRGCLEVAGYGDRHPRDFSEPDSPKNRRVEVVLEFREAGGSEHGGPEGLAICETPR